MACQAEPEEVEVDAEDENEAVEAEAEAGAGRRTGEGTDMLEQTAVKCEEEPLDRPFPETGVTQDEADRK